MSASLNPTRLEKQFFILNYIANINSGHIVKEKDTDKLQDHVNQLHRMLSIFINILEEELVKLQ